MAKGQINTLDLAIRNGTQIHALIEGVLTSAPELANVPAYPKAGISYTTLTRTGLPSGDFAKVGAGVAPEKSEWKREVGSMCKFEAQMRVPEDVVTIAQGENPETEEGDILADEALAYMRGSAIRIGSQFWYGDKVSPDGFAGLSTQVDLDTNEVNVGGAANADSCSAYLVYYPESSINPDGVHFVVGNNGRMSFADTWFKQQVFDPNDAAKQKLITAYCNNFLSFMGLVVTRKENVYRAKNINKTNPFTDAVAAEMLSKVPLALRADKSRWRFWLNSDALFSLQKSRATVNIATGTDKGVGKGGLFPEVPESAQGVMIVATDSLVSTERNGLRS